MKRCAILVGVLLIATTVRAEPPQGYRLVWEDNFDGDRLDLSKWTPETYLRRVAWRPSVLIGAPGINAAFFITPQHPGDFFGYLRWAGFRMPK